MWICQLATLEKRESISYRCEKVPALLLHYFPNKTATAAASVLHQYITNLASTSVSWKLIVASSSRSSSVVSRSSLEWLLPTLRSIATSLGKERERDRQYCWLALWMLQLLVSLNPSQMCHLNCKQTRCGETCYSGKRRTTAWAQNWIDTPLPFEAAHGY